MAALWFAPDPNSRARFFSAQCGIPTFLASGRIPERVFRVSMVEINLSDELIDLVGEDVLASAPDFDAITGDAEGWVTNRLETGSRITVP